MTTGFARLTDGTRVAIGTAEKLDRPAGSERRRKGQIPTADAEPKPGAAKAAQGDEKPRQGETAAVASTPAAPAATTAASAATNGPLQPSGPPRPLGRRRALRRRSGDSRAMSVSCPLHPPADRDLAAGRRACCSAACSAIGRCRCRRCRRSISRPSRSRRSCRAPTPTRSRRWSPRRWSASSGKFPSLSTMTSSSSFGISQITLQFDLNRDIDGAAQDVQAAINAAGSTSAAQPALSADLCQGEPGRRAGLTLALTSDTTSLRAIERPRRHHDRASASAEVTGVGHVSVLGGIQAGGAHPGRSGAACRLRHRAGGPAHRHRRPPMSPAPRARSTARSSPTPSPPTTRSPAPTPTSRSSSPTATARR